MFTWYWVADLCQKEGIAFVLGHAFYMKAIHGGKAKNDKIDAHKIAVLLRGGMFPQADVYPSEMRATRDLLRRRLRMCFWKQWRYVRTKVRELLKLGTAKKTAILTALSRKGPWHLSRTLATQTGMTTQWLTKTLGLVSIRAVWIALHYPT